MSVAGISLKFEICEGINRWSLVKEDGLRVRTSSFSELEPDEYWSEIDVVPVGSYFVVCDKLITTVYPLDGILVDRVALVLSGFKLLHCGGDSFDSAMLSCLVCFCTNCYGYWWTGHTAVTGSSEFSGVVLPARNCRRSRRRLRRSVLPLSFK